MKSTGVFYLMVPLLSSAVVSCGKPLPRSHADTATEDPIEVGKIIEPRGKGGADD
jgi:hypothetical protein